MILTISNSFNDNAEVVFTKELIQTKEDFEDCDVWGSLLSDKFIKGKINTQLFSYKESFQS